MIRISTGMIFDQGVKAINSQTAQLLHVQQQVASNRRILTPADDPVGAARALVVNQSVDVAKQFATNHDNAKSALGLEEGHLAGVNELMGRLKTLAVQAGNGALTNTDRRTIATELRARFDELMGIANAADGNGEFIFGGYMSKTRPFAASVDAYIQNAATAEASLYSGDDGQRRLQVSPTRFMEVGDAGNDIFMRIKNGNGHFATNYAAGNTGTGVIDMGSVTNPAAWNSASNSKNLEVRFWVDTTGAIGAANTTYYDLVDATSGNSLFTNAASATGAGGTYNHAYVANQPITFSGLAAPYVDFGASVVVSGAPASGDAFTIQASSSQSLFRTLAGLIGTLEAGTSGGASNAKYAIDIGNAIGNLDRANDNILRVRAAIGSRLSEVDSLASVNEDLKLQYQQTLSNIQDLDYAKAISDLTRKQTDLEAAQKSFLRTSQLSLFNYL